MDVELWRLLGLMRECESIAEELVKEQIKIYPNCNFEILEMTKEEIENY